MRERADPTAVRRANLGVILRHLAAAGPPRARRPSRDRPQQVDRLEPRGGARRARPGAATDAARRPRADAWAARRRRSALSGVDGRRRRARSASTASPSAWRTSRARCAARRADHVDLRASTPAPALDGSPRSPGRRRSPGHAPTGLRVVGVGVAVPGLVDVATGTLLRAPNLRLDAGAGRRRAGPSAAALVPDRRENESNLSALAELWDGAAQGLPAFVHVTGEVGVGSGIVIDGELYRGRAASPASSATSPSTPAAAAAPAARAAASRRWPASRPSARRAGLTCRRPRRACASPSSSPGVPPPATRAPSRRSTTAGDALGSPSPAPSTCSTSTASSSAARSRRSARGSCARVARARRHVLAADYSTFDVRASALGGRAACAAPPPCTCGRCSTGRGWWRRSTARRAPAPGAASPALPGQ